MWKHVLEKDGVLNAYRKARLDEYDNTELRLQFILYACNQSCMEQLDKYCKEAFHKYVNQYRQKLETFGEGVKREYEKIVKVHVSTSPFDLNSTRLNGYEQASRWNCLYRPSICGWRWKGCI